MDDETRLRAGAGLTAGIAVLVAAVIGLIVWLVFFQGDDEDVPGTAATPTASPLVTEEAEAQDEEFSSDLIRGGDINLIGGDRPPNHATLADIRGAGVTDGEGGLVFEATLGKPVPDDLEGESLELTWSILEDTEPTWDVVGTVILDPEAAVIDHRGDSDFDSGSGDFPGSISVDSATVTITVDTSAVANFPGSFEWRLLVQVEDSTDENQAVAEGVAPADGFETFGS